MTTTATQPVAPPPVDAELTGPVSAQPIGAISQEATASGEHPGAAETPGASGLGITPALTATPAYTGGSVSSAAGAASSSAVSGALAQQIATAISIGLAQAPTTAAGWAQLADYYSTPAGQNEITTAESSNPTSTASTAAAPGTTASAAPASATSTTTGALGTNAFLAAIRQHESGGDYTAENPAGGASGAYQFIQSTWTSEANAAGYGQYASEPAGKAPAAVQDAVAAHMANGYYSQYGSWQDAAEAWYEPSDVGKDVVPDPGAGNTESVTAYGQQIVSMMGQQPQLDAASPVAGSTNNIVKIAQSAIGLPYSWGGGGTAGPSKGIKGDPNDPNATSTVGFDCSGLSQWVYAQAGVTLPRVAQAQYNATPKVANNTPLQPGDLLFFGGSANSIEHVGIYIGNNQMIDAPHGGADVQIDQDPTSWANYIGATRPGDPTGATTASTGTAAATSSQSADQFGQILGNVTDQLNQLSTQYPGIFDQTESVMP